MHLFGVFLMEKTDKIALFEDKSIRKIWYNDQWFFLVVDVCHVLIDNTDYLTARKYRNKLSQRLRDE